MRSSGLGFRLATSPGEAAGGLSARLEATHRVFCTIGSSLESGLSSRMGSALPAGWRLNTPVAFIVFNRPARLGASSPRSQRALAHPSCSLLLTARGAIDPGEA